MFQRRGNKVIKTAIFKGKYMLPMVSIFFPLRVATARIENNIKGH